MRGDELRVIGAFTAWLTSDGWTVEREVDFCDVVANRGTTTIYAEAKGRTAAVGLDVDTLYGQLLRRADVSADGVVFGVVVPVEARAAALRVPEATRRALRVTVYVVDALGQVEVVEPSPLT